MLSRRKARAGLQGWPFWSSAGKKPSPHSQFMHHFWKSASVLLLLTKNHNLLFFLKQQDNYLLIFWFSTALAETLKRVSTSWVKPHHSGYYPWKVITTFLLNLSCFTRKATRFMGPEGETKHKSDHGLNHRTLFRPKVEVLKESLSAHSTTTKYYYNSYCNHVLSAGFVHFLCHFKRQIVFSKWLLVAHTWTTHILGRKETLLYPFITFKVQKCFKLIFQIVFSGTNGDFWMHAQIV